MMMMMEVDKGLRAKSTSQQCGAVVSCPRLLAQHPSSAVVNATFLKLAELFVTCANNTLRFTIYRTFSSCRTHLAAIVSIDSVVAKLAAVLQSTDPIACSITLRMLALLAPQLGRSSELHHQICDGITSTHSAEADAAYVAAEALCQSSARAAMSTLPLIRRLGNAVDTPLHIRLKLFRLARHAPVSEASSLRDLCIKSLQLPGEAAEVRVLIETSTLLSLNGAADVEAQAELLLDLAQRDPRASVKATALRALAYMCRKCPLVDYPIAPTALHVFLESSSARVQQMALLLVSELCHGSTVAKAASLAAALIEPCAAFIFRSDTTTALLAMQALAELLSSAAADEAEPVSTHHALAAQLVDMAPPLLLQAGISLQQASSLLQSLWPLCAADSSLLGSHSDSLLAIVTAAADVASDKDAKLGVMAACLARCLATEGSLLARSSADLAAVVGEAGHAKDAASQRRLLRVLKVLALALSAHDGPPKSNAAGELGRLLECAELSSWLKYRVSQYCMQAGLHAAAVPLLAAIAPRTESEASYCWLSALLEFSRALSSECATQQQQLQKCQTLLCASCAADTLQYQQRYVAAHIELCSALLQIDVLLASPLALHGASSAHIDGYCRRIRRVSTMLQQLCTSAFSTDRASEVVLHGQQQHCLLVVHILECTAACQSNQPPPHLPTALALLQTVGGSDASSAELWQSRTKRTCIEVLRRVEARMAPSGAGLGSADAANLIRSLRPISAQVPPHFFRTMPPVRCELSTEPAARSATESLNVAAAVGLVLNISAVVERIPAQCMRRVQRIEVRAQLELISENGKPAAIAVWSSKLILSARGAVFATQVVLPIPEGAAEYAVRLEPVLVCFEGLAWPVDDVTVLLLHAVP